jgi:hypothetical protein
MENIKVKATQLKDDQQKFIDATVSGIRSGKKRLLAEMTA